MKILLSLSFTLLLLAFSFPVQPTMAQDDSTKTPDQESANVPAALDFQVKSIEGEDVNLADYTGKVLVVVNVASKCGYTRQYADMQKLYAKHADDGLMVLGFPCNQFGGQEPGSDADIAEFCSSKFDVTFDMFSKVDVKGESACDFYKYLTGLDIEPKGAGDVGWNFEKFVIDRSGKVIGRFGTKTELNDDAFVKLVQTALSAK